MSWVADDADLDEDAKSNFVYYSDGIEVLEEIMELDEETKELVEVTREAIADATKSIENKQDERKDSDHSDWNYISSVSRRPDAKPTIDDEPTKRSIFEDVDR